MREVRQLRLKKWSFAGLAGVLLAGSAAAHHGFFSYSDEEYTLTGTVVSMYFGFPHPRLLIEADGEQWDLWLAAWGRVRHSCFHEFLSEGDQIAAVGHRVPDERRLEMKAKAVTLRGELFDFYPAWNPLGGNPNPQREEPCPTDLQGTNVS